MLELDVEPVSLSAASTDLAAPLPGSLALGSAGLPASLRHGVPEGDAGSDVLLRALVESNMREAAEVGTVSKGFNSAGSLVAGGVAGAVEAATPSDEGRPAGARDAGAGPATGGGSSGQGASLENTVASDAKGTAATDSAAKRRTLGSEAQRRYRERQKEKMRTLERTVEKLTARVHELESSAAETSAVATLQPSFPAVAVNEPVPPLPAPVLAACSGAGGATAVKEPLSVHRERYNKAVMQLRKAVDLGSATDVCHELLACAMRECILLRSREQELGEPPLEPMLKTWPQLAAQHFTDSEQRRLLIAAYHEYNAALALEQAQRERINVQLQLDLLLLVPAGGTALEGSGGSLSTCQKLTQSMEKESRVKALTDSFIASLRAERELSSRFDLTIFTKYLTASQMIAVLNAAYPAHPSAARIVEALL